MVSAGQHLVCETVGPLADVWAKWPCFNRYSPVFPQP